MRGWLVPATISVLPPRSAWTTPEHPVLLFFDAECHFCSRWVNRVHQADTARRIRLATLQGSAFRQLGEEYPQANGVHAVVALLRDSRGREQFLTRSEAIHAVVRGLPGFRWFELALDLFPIPIADLGYRLVARFRGSPFVKLTIRNTETLANHDLFLD